ncbi:MAG: tandem-95 repeat protein [Gemmataceae bacterium]
MPSPLTNWLRPAPRRPSAALAGLERLEARENPNTTPFVVSVAPVGTSGGLLQDWSNVGLLATANVWTAAPSVEGYAGKGLTAGTAGNASTITAAAMLGTDTPAGVQSLTPNQTTPNTATAVGVVEFDGGAFAADPVVALRSGTNNESPFIVFYVDMTAAPAAGVWVSFTVRDIQTNTNGAIPLAVQYRGFVTGTEAFANATGVGAILPDATQGGDIRYFVQVPKPATGANNTQIRFITTTPAAGATQYVGLDYINISISRPPTLTLGSQTVEYTEGTEFRYAQTTGLVTDADSADFDQGSLLVKVSGGTAAQDVLGVYNEGNGSGQVSYVAATRAVRYNFGLGPVQVGTVDATQNGSPGQPLLITFNASATPTAVQAVVRNLSYRNTSKQPDPAPRTITAVLQDGDGGITVPVNLALTIKPVNDPPLADPGTTAVLNYPLNTGPVLVAPGALVTDPDAPTSPNFNGGILTVSIVSGGNADNRLTVQNSTFTGAGAVGVTPSGNIEYTLTDGVTKVIVARISSGGFGTSPLKIEFNNDAATPAVAQAIMRRISFETVGLSFSLADRVLRFNLTDGDGVDQFLASTVPTVYYADSDTFRTIRPQASNTVPSFTVPAAAAAVVEDAGAQTTAGFATAISPGLAGYEAAQVLTFNVTGNTNPGLFAAGPAISPTGQLTYTPAANAFGTATVTVTLSDDGSSTIGPARTSAGQSFTITVRPVNDAPAFTASAPPAVNEDSGPQTVAGFVTTVTPGPANESAQTVVRYETEVLTNPGLFAAAPSVSTAGALSYAAAPDAFGTATFRVRVQDNGGTTDGGVDLSPWTTFTVTVNAVNDDPVVAGVTSPVGYLTGQPGLPIAPAATVSDVDSADFDTGTLTVSYASGGTASDLLAVRRGGPITVSGSDVFHTGVLVGSFTGGTGTTALVVTFNAAATPAVVQDVLRNVVFSTPAGTVDRVLSVVLTDGDGGTGTAGVTIQVADSVTVLSLAKTNAAPVVAGPSLTWRLTADLPVSGFSPGSFALTGDLVAAVTDPLVVTQVGPTTIDITATVSVPVQGTLGLNFVDATGLSVGITNSLPVVGGVYSVDRVGPAVTSIDDGDADDVVPVNQPVTYTVTFSEDVQDGTFTAADLANAGTAPVTFGAVTETSPGVFAVVVTPTGPGTIILRVPAAAVVLDVLGNDNPAAFADDTTVTVDAVAPTVASFANDTASAPPNVTAPGQVVTYTVTFSEDVDPASLAGKFSNAGTATATVGTPTRTGSGVVTVTLTPSTTGKLVLRVAGVTDVAGNPMAAAAADPVAVTSNLPPTPQNDAFSLPEDGGTYTSPARGVLANDTDPNDASLTLTADTPAIALPTKGTLVLRSDGTFDYTPNLNATGTDTFQYRVRDPFGGTATATVTLTITPVNDPPTYTVAVPNITVLEDSGTTSGVTVLRDILPGPAGETEAINPIVVTASPSNLFSVQPSILRVTLPGGELTGVLTFTPAPNQFGTATITVTVSDAGPGAAPNVNATTQQFTISITPVNDAPTLILTGNPPVSAEDGGLQTVPGFASFSPGPNENGLGQTASYTASVLATSGGLTFTSPPAIDANGTLTYQAAPDASGTATVRVALRDSGGTADGGADTALFTQQFTIVVRAQNDLPIANPDSGLVPAGAGPTFVDTLTNDTPDPDGSEVLTVVAVTQPGNGTAAVAPGGRGVLYTPAAGFVGTDTFTYTINDGNGGPATSTVTVVVRPVPAGQPIFDVIATGTGPGGGPVVRVNSLSTGAFTGTFAAYDPSFRGGVNVAVGDVNGDGVPDVVVTPGPGGGPHVKVVDGAKLGLVDPVTGAISDAAVLASFFAYSPSFTGGVKVVAADMDGDGKADIVTGTGDGGGAHVKVISGAALARLGNLSDGQVNPGAVIGSFFAYDPSFRGGVNVAAGDVNGDGRADVITAAGAGGGSHVKVFSGLGGPILQSFFAYGASFTGGVNVAAGDVNGDGRADVITGAGLGGGPHVKVFDSGGGLLASFLGLTGSAAGADVAYRVTNDATPLVVVGGQSGGSQVRTFAAPNFELYSEFDAYEPTFLGGVEVG